MRGEVLYYDESQGFGFIHADDGERYTFTREDLRRETAIGQGAFIEFQPHGGQAREIFVIRAQADKAASAAPPQPAVLQLGADQAAAQPAAHFGRLATEDERQAATGLWGYFWRAVTTNYVNFGGRARRKEYWGYALFWTIAFVVLLTGSVAQDVASGYLDMDGRDLPIVTFGIVGTFVVATFFPGLALAVRRLHDIGLPGWVVLVLIIPLGWLVMLVVALWPTQMRENQWGPIPEGIGA